MSARASGFEDRHISAFSKMADQLGGSKAGIGRLDDDPKPKEIEISEESPKA